MTVRPPRAEGVVAFLAVTTLVAVLGAAGVLPRWSGLVHLVALPPLDLMADLRWLLATAPSWPWFLGLLVVVLTVRVAVLAVLVGGAGRPRWRLAAGFYGAALGPALLVALLDFAAHAVLYARVYGAALITAGVTFAVLGAAPWTGSSRLAPGLRSSVRAGLRLPLLGGYAAALLVAGAVAELGGLVGAVLMVPLVAVLTLGTATRLARARPRRPAAGAATVVAFVVAATAAVVVTRGEPWPDPPQAQDGSVLLMSGINSSSGEGAIVQTAPHLLGYTCDQVYYFSYAGTGDGQPQGDATCPIRTGAPYDPDHTQRPFGEQVELLEAQVAQLEPPVVVMGHSQAAWVVWQAASEERLGDAPSLVLVGPFPSSPVGWPPPGQRERGHVAGDLLRLLEPLPDLADFDFVVDAPLSRELLATPDAASAVFDRPLPDDAAVLAVASAADVPLMPDGWQIRGASNACPVREAHPYLPITPAFYRVVGSFLDGGREGQPPCAPWAEAYRVVTQPFGVPPVE